MMTNDLDSVFSHLKKAVSQYFRDPENSVLFFQMYFHWLIFLKKANMDLENTSDLSEKKNMLKKLFEAHKELSAIKESFSATIERKKKSTSSVILSAETQKLLKMFRQEQVKLRRIAREVRVREDGQKKKVSIRRQKWIRID